MQAGAVGQQRLQCTLRGRIQKINDPTHILMLGIALERRFGQERVEDEYYVMNVEQALHAQDMGEMIPKLETGGHDFSIDVFLLVWSHIERMCVAKEKFAIRWFMKDEERLLLFLRCIIGLEVKRLSKGLLHNGYMNCLDSGIPLFHPKVWEKIDDLFTINLSYSCIPKPMKTYIGALSSVDLMTFTEDRINEWKRELFEKKCFSRVDVEVEKICSASLRASQGCFLGVREEEFLKQFRKEDHWFFRAFPTDFVVMREMHNHTCFFERVGTSRRLIAMVISRPGGLSSHLKLLIRTLMEELWIAHGHITRSSSASFDGHMVGCGPLFNRFKKGKNVLSFYTSMLKVKILMKNCKCAASLQELVDRHAHTDLIEILLGLFMWWCPEQLKFFFEFSSLYMDFSECGETMLERTLGGKGPPAYQLYISKDYCSEVHVDRDATEMTLCYASHPDRNISQIDFVLAKYGARMPISDAEVFAFRSNCAHATAYRVPTSSAAYVGCVAVNNPLRNLMARRIRQSS